MAGGRLVCTLLPPAVVSCKEVFAEASLWSMVLEERRSSRLSMPSSLVPPTALRGIGNTFFTLFEIEVVGRLVLRWSHDSIFEFWAVVVF